MPPKLLTANRKKYDATYAVKTKKTRHEFFLKVGSYCLFCRKRKHLKCHRTDWIRHVPFENMSRVKLAAENPKEYARVCFGCHYGVHWLHDRFGLTWPEILALKARKRKV